MGYESRHAGHYNRRQSVQGLSLRVQPGEPPALGTGLLPGDPTRWDAWLVTSPQGEVRVRYRTDEALGVIDFHLSPAPGVEALAASRVLPNGDGAAYVFTQFQTPGMPDDVFTGQVHALREELVILKALLEGRTVEAAPSCAPVR